MNSTSVSTASESQVMSITVQGTTYEKAAKTVNAISNVFQSQIPLIMKIDNVAILSEAKVDSNASPINMKTTLSIIVSLFAGLVLAIALVFLMDYLDDTFKSEAELEKEPGSACAYRDIQNEKRRSEKYEKLRISTESGGWQICRG